ncbi:unnamed protein product [Acanthosepion pharaonis]|uniref:Endonuclease/exonuclease/phosphatase domain-containing protein n=1 Tax=Acanthosepion pharaonis TaxID=158019 RepID=A0A812ER29_ACAPH|nr:unnamed protein product [Sepia pharaonis]
MRPILADDIQQIDDARKNAVIDRELSKLGIDIAFLQETRLAEAGLPQDDPRQHGIGFAVKNSLIPAIVPPTGRSERILALHLLTSTSFANVLCIYAPTLCATSEVRDHFYEAIDEISSYPNTEGLYLLGDISVRVEADCDTWPSCLDRQGISKMNENRQRLCVTNTYFKFKERHKVSWRHPRSRHWHQLDLVITRRADLRSVLHTRSFHSADCDTDHSLVGCKVRLTAKEIHRSKTKGLSRIDTCRSNDPESSRRFQTTFSPKVDTSSFSATDIDSRWHHLRDVIYTSALTAFGKKDRQNADWYEAHGDEMQPASEAKRQALLAYKHNPCVNTRDVLRAARSRVQQTARCYYNDYYRHQNRHRPHSHQGGSAEVRGEGEVITDRGKQLERWVEHYLELYATRNMVTDAALDALPSLPVMEELDAPPSAEELGKAIDCLSCGRAPERDGIPSEVLKSGKPALLEHLHKLLCLCWEKGYVPRNMRESNICHPL